MRRRDFIDALHESRGDGVGTFDDIAARQRVTIEVLMICLAIRNEA